MKRLAALTALFVFVVTAIVWYSNGELPLNLPAAQQQTQPEETTETQTEQPAASTVKTKAVWVATAYAIDYPSTATTDAEQLKARCNEILDTAAANGCDTVYLQVRPACDALYHSDIFPWSKYLTGSIGTAPSNDFDPLEYWAEQAHSRDLKLHAWINPYRICAGQNAAADFEALPDSSPAKQHPEWVVECDGGYYFNPGIAEVRDLICDGVREIVKNYDVDGIQFDDYFYPSTDFDDGDTYAAYTGELSRDDWRRDNVNQLVQAVYTIVHKQSKNPLCVFGISPSGIWRNKGVGAYNGSKTNGYEHYTSAYADSLTWIENGWIDYICPQIYWEIGNEAADFDTLAHWWANQTDGTDVELILGLAAYKIGDDTYGDIWEPDGCAEIGRQIDLIGSMDDIDGYAIFSYRNLENTDGLCEILSGK